MSHAQKGDTSLPVVRLGLDIAKSSFQVHGVDAHSKVVIRKQLTRGTVLSYFAQLPSCLIGLGSVWRGALLGAGGGEARARRAVAGRAVHSALSYAPEE